MKAMIKKVLAFGLIAACCLGGTFQAEAAINGLTGSVFNLSTGTGYVSTAEGNSLYFWGYGAAGLTQYPGPTLIVTAGQTVTVNLTNSLTVPTSIVFPGQQVTAGGGVAGLITQEAAANGGTVSYSFTPSQPGTYTYFSGTQSDIQISLGLFGALIVRPANFNPAAPTAYGTADSAYAREYLFLLSEMDPNINEKALFGQLIDTTTYKAVYWFINGRTAVDTLDIAQAPWLPTQPYNCLPLYRPGEKVLLRFVGGGRDLHPFHTHGQHHRVIARDGRLLESVPGSGVADLSTLEFTNTVAPGQTSDALFQWTGYKLGWDIYGDRPHTCTPNAEGFDPTTYEYCADHGKPLPVVPALLQNILTDLFYSGSPYLGSAGQLPPGEGGYNLYGAFPFMWHSHAENELVNYNIFPGGMLTMSLMVPPVALGGPVLGPLD